MRDERLLNFGPWISPVNKIDDLPQTYQSAYKDTNDFEYLLKIPANINRMNITKDTELFTNVIGVYNDHIYLISRENNVYTDEKIMFKDMLYIKHSISLLNGEFYICTKNREISIFYNAVSSEEMKKLEDIIRMKYILGGFIKNMEMLKENVEFPELEPYQKVIVNKLKEKEERLSFVAHQTMMELTPESTDKKRFFVDFIHTLHKTYLLGFLCMHNGKELIIVGRDKHYKEAESVNYSSSVIYIPLEKIENIKEFNNLHFSHLKEFKISLIGNSLNIMFDDSNKEKDHFKELL